MKVYVDELPKSCGACPHCYHEHDNIYCCVIHNRFMEFFNDDYLKREKNCPLQSLADYTKQVRKEVCEEIGEQLGLRFDGKWQVVSDGCMTGDKTIMAVLDQIQGESGHKQ